jgi:hypothetical protein
MQNIPKHKKNYLLSFISRFKRKDEKLFAFIEALLM